MSVVSQRRLPAEIKPAQREIVKEWGPEVSKSTDVDAGDDIEHSTEC